MRSCRWICTLAVLCWPLSACGAASAPDSGGPAAEEAFTNSVNPPPADWQGPVFELSHDYPAYPPAACDPAECPWLGVPVNFQNREVPQWSDYALYMEAILDYIRQGNDLSANGWSVVVDGRTRWYHVPWQAYNKQVGREYIHGMTNERNAGYTDLVGSRPDHTLPIPDIWFQQFQSWAVGMYNSYGASLIGHAIGPDGVPRSFSEGPMFPEGTLVLKTLFTEATPEVLPSLDGSPTWLVNRHLPAAEPNQWQCSRAPQEVRLIQVDIAVVDARSPTRWVYGTFAYNGALDHADPWDNLEPLGLMWGNDPDAWPGNPYQTKATIMQSVLAPNTGTFQHYGCAPPTATQRRLAGPVDSGLSACLSCHQNAYYTPVGEPPKDTPMPTLSFGGLCELSNLSNRNYFSNLERRGAYPDFPGTMPLDTSLQLRVAYKNYNYFATGTDPNDACVIQPLEPPNE